MVRPTSKPFLGVAVLAERGIDAKALVRTINATKIGRVVFYSRIRIPEILAPKVLEEMRDSNCKVVVVAADSKDAGPMIQAVTLLSISTVDVSVFAYGEMSSPMTIVQAMRGGAREYLERPTSPQEMDRAFERLLQLPPDDEASSPFSPLPPDSGPSGSSPPTVLVGVPRPRGPKTLPSRKAVPEEFGLVFPYLRTQSNGV